MWSCFLCPPPRVSADSSVFSRGMFERYELNGGEDGDKGDEEDSNSGDKGDEEDGNSGEIISFSLILCPTEAADRK